MIEPAAPVPILLLDVPRPSVGPSPVAQPRFVALLARTAAEAQGERVTIGALAEAFGQRGHGALLVLLGLPNATPLPVPALSLLTGFPLLILAAQVATGRPKPWFPSRLRDRAIPTGDLRRLADAVAARLAWLDRFVRPRWLPLTSGPARRLLGCFALVLALALFLPLPFGNALPGLALALIGLALLERDGAAALLALTVGLAGLAVTAAASAAILGGVAMAIREVFG